MGSLGGGLEFSPDDEQPARPATMSTKTATKLSVRIVFNLVSLI